MFLLPRATPSRVTAKHADQPLGMRVTNIPGPALELNLNSLLFAELHKPGVLPLFLSAFVRKPRSSLTDLQLIPITLQSHCSMMVQ